MKWIAVIVFLFYMLFPMFAIYQTYTNPNFGNKYGDDFNLEEAREHIKKVQEKLKEKFKEHND